MPTTSKNPKATSNQSTIFLRSANIEQDAESIDAVARYIPTTNSLRSIRRIIEAVSAGGATAWTLTGPYGTGKSAFLLFLSHLLGPKGSKLTTTAVKILRESAPELASAIFPTQQHRYGLSTIYVSASSEPITEALLRGLIEARNSKRIKLSTKHAKLLRGLESKRDNEQLVSESDLLHVLEELLKSGQTKEGKLPGLLLLVDEMGKLLEFAAANSEASNVFFLQQLAELAARSKGKLALITTLHQDFRAYANGLTSADRKEWEKIRGRYEDIAFEEPTTQLLKFVSAAWSRIREIQGIQLHKSDTSSVRKLTPDLWEHGTAPVGLSLKDGIELLSSCAPMHPSVAVLLGPLFRRVGQNERSAFSFLLSDEPQSLQEKLRLRSKKGGLFTVEDLYQYLVSSLGNALLNTPDAKRWAEAIEAESRHPQLSRHAVSVLRTVAVLAIASRWSNFRASEESIQHALSGVLDAKTVSAAIRELESCSVIVHRRFNNSYVLWEGSDVDVEARLSEGRTHLRDSGNVADLLSEHYDLLPVLARRHAFTTGTLRFFDVCFSSTQDMVQASTNLELDGRVIVVIPQTKDEHRDALRLTTCLGDRVVMRLLETSGPLAELATELGAIKWVIENTPEIESDATARRELHARKLATTSALDEIMRELLSGTGRVGGTWHWAGSRMDIRTSRDLNEQLSEICDQTFSSAPTIDNEIINRRELSSAAAAARRNLIERMIENSEEEELGLSTEVNPPERSIYRSLLGTEGLSLHTSKGQDWTFRKPPTGSDGYEVVSEVNRFFDSCTKERQPVTSLFETLTAPPFGLREGPIPIIFCACLLMRDADVALYVEDAFCPKLTPAIMERLIKSPELFTVRHWKVGGVRNQVFERLEKLVLGTNPSEASSKRRMLQVARPMMKFVGLLPEYTLNTSDLSPSAIAVRDAFTQATEPDTLLFDQLPEAFGIEPFRSRQRLKDREKDVSKFAKAIRGAFDEMRAAYPNLVTTIQDAISDAFGLTDRNTEALRGHLQKVAVELKGYVSERDIKMLVDRILDDTSDQDQWLEGVASLIAERPVSKWRDDDRAHFSVRLQQFVRRMNLLLATVQTRPDKSQSSTQSIRLAMTSTKFGQLDHVLHIDPSRSKQIRTLQSALEKQLSKAPDTSTAIAAIVNLAQKLLTAADTDDQEGQP